MNNKCFVCKKGISKQAKKCKSCSKIGHPNWNTGKTYFKKGEHVSKKTEFIKGEERITGKNHYLWKGDKVGIKALHRWVRNHRGRPNKCELCGTEKEKIYDWANISHKYYRDLNDWIRLCRKCHRKYDNEYKIKMGISLRKILGHYKKK